MSTLSEKKARAILITHLGMGDMLSMCGAARHIKKFYEELVVVCKEMYETNTKMMYADDPAIRILPIPADQPENQVLAQIIDQFLNQDYNIFLCGIHKFQFTTAVNKPISDIHQWFYEDLGIPISEMRASFRIADFKESNPLVEMLASTPYVFIHTRSSNREIEIDLEKFKKENLFIVNPNKNVYSPTDPFYALAEKYVNLPLLFYKDVIRNAKELHLVDSSFSCLAGLLLTGKPSTDQSRHLYTRDTSRYPHLFDETWIYHA